MKSHDSVCTVVISNVLLQMTNPGFEISILQRNKIIQFEPTFNKFKEVMLNVYDQMISAVSSLPRLETKLYIDLVDSHEQLKVGSYLSLLGF